jgi:hypothetical protein
MSTANKSSDANFILAFPEQYWPGTNGVVIPEEHKEEIDSLEKSGEVRLWTVRAIISDHVPLAGTLEVLRRPLQHSLKLNVNPLIIYLHRGGRNAVYYDLWADAQSRLSHIELRVKTATPDCAFMLAWEPFNALLDQIAINYPLPLVISRLELVGPNSGEVIAYNLVLPNPSGLELGPLGGINVQREFIPANAIWREAINSSNPFYRLLCAYRLEDAIEEIRTVARELLRGRQSEVRLPPETKVDAGVLQGLGFSEDTQKRIRTLRDLFDEHRTLRNAIAHFLIPTDSEEKKKAYVPISDGHSIRSYSIVATALLYHVGIKLGTLRDFFRTNGLSTLRGGQILPLPEKKLDFPVIDPKLTHR